MSQTTDQSAQKSALYPYLTYAGALPFIACAIAFVFHNTTLPVLGRLDNVLMGYGLVIAAFMSGVHWGQHLHLEDNWTKRLPLLSNAITIGLWLSFLLLSFQGFLGALIVAFSLLLFIDFQLLKSQHLTLHYFKTRCKVTGLVVVSLIICLFAA